MKRCARSLWVSDEAEDRARRAGDDSTAGMAGRGASLHASSPAESFANAMTGYAAARMLICAWTHFHNSAISCAERPLGAASITVRPSIIEAAKSVRW